MGTMMVQNTGVATVVATEKKLVSFCADSIRKSLRRSLEPEHKAFLSYLDKVTESGESLPFHGRFIVVGKMDDGKMAYFIYPKKFGVVGDNTKSIKIPNIPKDLGEAICERCQSTGIEFVHDTSSQAIAISETMGKVGKTCSLGRIVEVIE